MACVECKCVFTHLYVARITPIVFLSNYPSHDFGKMEGVFPPWCHRIFAAQLRLDRTRDRIAAIA